jgi:hypothetical protein
LIPLSAAEFAAIIVWLIVILLLSQVIVPLAVPEPKSIPVMATEAVWVMVMVLLLKLEV